MWQCQDKERWKNKPKCLCDSTSVKKALTNRNGGCEEGLEDIVMTLDLSGLKFMNQSFAQCSSFTRSLEIVVCKSVGHLHESNRMLASVKSEMLEQILSDMSKMKTRKRSGPKTEP